jgi:regulation of enolase protein 1 (concanavalin A-like superfamily)
MVTIDGLPELAWTNGDGEAAYADGVLTLVGASSTDWIIDGLGGERQDSATALVFAAPAAFALSARIEVGGPRSIYDAGALVLWADRDHWAKFAFEYSPQEHGVVVSVVTNDYSDDCNSSPVEADSVWLRISRVGPGWALHASDDGRFWTLIRIFRLNTENPISVGFLAQSPLGDGRTVQFHSILLSPTAPTELRDGS